MVIGLLVLGLSVNYDQAHVIVFFVLAILLAVSIMAFAFIREKRKKDRLARSGIDEIDEMSGLEFEKYLQLLLIRKGYEKVKLTDNYDLGVDITAEKNGVTWGIQAKRYKSAVGLDAVRQVVAAATHYKCEKTMVITNSYFTPNTVTIADSVGCVLVDRTKLVELILSSDR